ncbi:unnamed protein product [Sphagnum balticum]
MQGMALDIKKDFDKGVAQLAAVTHARVVEMASEELHSSRKTFMDNLSFEEVAAGVWVVAVDEKGLWVEEGIEPNFDMKPGLLKGKPYRVIPFDHGKAPSQLNGYAQNLVSNIRAQLKKEKVPFKKLENYADGPNKGKPIAGQVDKPVRLHTFDFSKGRQSQGSGFGGNPDLKGVNIYQTLTKSGNVRRDIMTFRTVSSGPASEGKFIHPGTKRHKFLDRALEWGTEIWETKILPEILDKYSK